MDTGKEAHHAESFYGVYLLCSESSEKRYKGKCYIGFTVNPKRRIKQHNRGKEFGGAKKTNNKGPWKMVMIVHGFPNNISALQFEWAWQQPAHSTRLKIFPELRRKLPKETYFDYNFRILSRMLNVGPWYRLPLIVQWLELDYKRDFDCDLLPPRHIRIVSGVITIEKPSTAKNKTEETASQRTKLWAKECHLCMKPIDTPERSRMGCLNPTCKLTAHIICLADYMIASDIQNRGHYIPISGECPLCETELLWGDLVQHKKRMMGRQSEEVSGDETDDDEDEMDINLDVPSSDDEEPIKKDDDNDDYKTLKPSTGEPIEIYEISD